jgi:hypothetical protein
MPLNTISCGAPPISCFIAPLTSSTYRYIYHKYPQVLAIGVINYLSYQTRAPPCMFHSFSSKIYIFPLYVHYMSIMLPWNHCNPHFHTITAITGMNPQQHSPTLRHPGFHDDCVAAFPELLLYTAGGGRGVNSHGTSKHVDCEEWSSSGR